MMITLVNSIQEAEDGSVCFDNCNGHGKCIDYTCHCYDGWHGDSCKHTFSDDDQDNIIPILTAGHYNVTTKNFTQAIIKNKVILVGFSAYSCYKCISVEADYKNISDILLDMKIPFARANADNLKSIALEHGASDVPSLVFFQKQRPILYKGVHSVEPVIAYIKKQMNPALILLKNVSSVQDFLLSRKNPEYSISTVMVIGFFSEHKDIEEDEYDEYKEIAEEMKEREDVYFGAVTDRKVSNFFKVNKTIDRTPSLLMIGEDNIINTINLNELFDKGGIKGWITMNAIPLVGKLTGSNFRLYEKLPRAMIMLFLDLTNEDQSADPSRIVGGKSGGILNENLLDEFRQTAKEFKDKLSFVYLDGNLHEDQMRLLGLYGGKERLPSIAFNTRDGSQIPFPEELPINKDTLTQYCADFLTGKLKTESDIKEMAKKQLQSVKPINTKNLASRKEKKKAPEIKTGISEQFGDGLKGDDAVVTVDTKNFDDIVMNDDKDVVLLLHAKGCEACAHFAVYYKRMASRFKELAIPSLIIARMDITDETPPAHLNLIQQGGLPIVVMIPSGAKYPPWSFYSGIGKMQPMMKWVHKHVGIPFELENLPHLDDHSKKLYKEQVREREEALEKKRKEEQRAMDKEERAKKELERKRRKQQKLQQQREQDSMDLEF